MSSDDWTLELADEIERDPDIVAAREAQRTKEFFEALVAARRAESEEAVAEAQKARFRADAAAREARAAAEAAAENKRIRAEAAAAKRKAAAVRRAARQKKRASELLELGLQKERAEALAVLRSGPYDVVLSGAEADHNPGELGAVLQDLGYRKRQARNVILRSINIAPEVVALKIHEADAIHLKVTLENAGARVRIQSHAASG